jgi:hypothetical protein
LEGRLCWECERPTSEALYAENCQSGKAISIQSLTVDFSSNGASCTESMLQTYSISVFRSEGIKSHLSRPHARVSCAIASTSSSRFLSTFRFGIGRISFICSVSPSRLFTMNVRLALVIVSISPSMMSRIFSRRYGGRQVCTSPALDSPP